MIVRVSWLGLVMLTAWIVCGPVKAQTAPYRGISIDAFTADAQGPLAAGDVLHIALRGTRSGKATFAIPGLVESASMPEVSPGNYAGAYTVPKNVSLSGAAVIGRLTYPAIESPLVPADNALTIDSVAPRVSFVSPSKGATVENVRPLIYAVLSDAGSGVKADSVRIAVDGTNITSQAIVTPFSVSVTPVLTPGIHTVTVSASDRVGNVGSISWQFTVAPSVLTSSFSVNAAPGQSIAVNKTIRFTLKAQQSGQGKVTIAGVSSDIALGEGRPGVYTGEYTVRPGDDGATLPVVALFRASNGKRVVVPLSDGLTISAGPPRPPQITDPPLDDVEAGETISFAGTSLPGATVRVTLSYVSKATGGLFPIHGVASIQEVTADDKGNWRIDGISLRQTSLLARGQSTAYTLAAVTVASNGDVSAPAKISVHRT